MELIALNLGVCDIIASWDFTDMYALSPRALGVYISKIPCNHDGITVIYKELCMGGLNQKVFFIGHTL